MKVSHVVALLIAGSLTLGMQLTAAQYGAGGQKAKPTSQGKATPQKKAVKAGGSHTMTGCLMKGTEANTFMLMQIEGAGPKEAELINVPANLNLSAHLGHKVSITGTNVSVREAARTESGMKKPTKSEQKEEAGQHHMRPTAVKMIASTCP